MKKTLNIAAIILVPLFSAVAVCGFIFIFAFHWVRKIDSLAFLSVGRSSAYQVLITIGLLWASFYLLVWVVTPPKKYREALTLLSTDRLGTGCIGIVGPISDYAFAFDMTGGYIYLGELIGALIHFLGILGLGVSIFAIIPVMLIETVLYVSDIASLGKIGYWKSLVVSVFYILVLPLIIVFGMELAMATPVKVVDCAACTCPTAKKTGHSSKSEVKAVDIRKPDGIR